MPVLLSVIALALLAVPAADGDNLRPLKPAFLAWAKGSEAKTYEAMVLEFLAASGQSTAGYLEAVGELEQEIRSSCNDRSDPRGRLVALRTALFGRRGMVSDADLVDLENLLPNRILARKRGYCLGLSLLILHLGERLDWPLVAVWAPRHTFIRYHAGEDPLNFETTLSGAIHDDAWYRRRFGLSERAQLIEMTPRQLAAHLLNNHGYVLLEHGASRWARPQFDSALQLFPGLVEARINLGVEAARNREFTRAIAEFDRAAVAWPGDPFIALNRISALVQLGRAVEAAKLGETLLEQHPGFTPAFDRLSRARAQIDHRRHWKVIQSLSDRLNRLRVGNSDRRKGLRGQYFGGRNFEKKILERFDEDLAFSWRWNSPASGVPTDNFSIRWEGYFEVERSDRYTIRAVCSDGVRIRVDGALLIDEWRVSTDNFAETTVELEPGLHDITVEYFESRGDAGLLVLFTAEKEDLVLQIRDLFFYPTG